tara:strand:- start:960 stop:1295 length:336 start_codon:yes stop_codon:yes gene_type:complete
MKNYDDFEMALDEVIDGVIDEVVDTEVDEMAEKANFITPELVSDPLHDIPVFDDSLPDSAENSCQKCDKKFNLLSEKLDKIRGSLVFHYWVEAGLIFVVLLYMILDFLIKG